MALLSHHDGPHLQPHFLCGDPTLTPLMTLLVTPLECFAIKSAVWGSGQTYEKNQLFNLRPDLPHTWPFPEQWYHSCHDLR